MSGHMSLMLKQGQKVKKKKLLLLLYIIIAIQFVLETTVIINIWLLFIMISISSVIYSSSIKKTLILIL